MNLFMKSTVFCQKINKGINCKMIANYLKSFFVYGIKLQKIFENFEKNEITNILKKEMPLC